MDTAVKTRENMKLGGRPGSGSRNQGNEPNYSGSCRDKNEVDEFEKYLGGKSQQDLVKY